GAPARFTFAPLPARRYAARVREVAPAADPQSRTYRVKLTLAGGQGADAVRLGMTGDALLAPAGDSARAAAATAPLFKIPATAIFHQGGAPAVWVIRGKESTLEL